MQYSSETKNESYDREYEGNSRTDIDFDSAERGVRGASKKAKRRRAIVKWQSCNIRNLAARSSVLDVGTVRDWELEEE